MSDKQVVPPEKSSAGQEVQRLGVLIVSSVFMLYFSVSFFLAMWGAIAEQNLREDLQLRGVEMEGRINYFRGVAEQEYRLGYEYITPQQDGGQRFERRTDVDEATFNRARLDAPVAIVYLPDQPETSRLATQVASTAFDDRKLNELIIWGSLTGFSIIIVLWAFIKYRRSRVA